MHLKKQNQEHYQRYYIFNSLYCFLPPHQLPPEEQVKRTIQTSTTIATRVIIFSIYCISFRRYFSLYSSSELATAITTTYGTSACGTENEDASISNSVMMMHDDDAWWWWWWWWWWCLRHRPHHLYPNSIHTIPIHICNHTTILHHHTHHTTNNSLNFVDS